MSHDFWYLSRAAAFTAYGLLFFSTVLGIMIGTRFTGRFSRNTMFDIHKFTAILALAFSIFHVAVLLGDGFFNFSVWQLAVPFASPYRAWQTAAGVFGIYLLAIIVASFYVRRITGYRVWHVIHFSTFALFGLVTLHGVTAGTDGSSTWARLIYLGAGLTVLALTFYRLQHHMPVATQARRVRFGAAGAASFAAVLLILTTGIARPSSGSDENALAVTFATVLDQRALSASQPDMGVALQGDNDRDDDEHEEREHETREGDHDDWEEHEDDD